MASCRIESSSWSARSFALTAAAEMAETAARVKLCMFGSSLVSRDGLFTLIHSFAPASPTSLNKEQSESEDERNIQLLV